MTPLAATCHTKLAPAVTTHRTTLRLRSCCWPSAPPTLCSTSLLVEGRPLRPDDEHTIHMHTRWRQQRAAWLHGERALGIRCWNALAAMRQGQGHLPGAVGESLPGSGSMVRRLMKRRVLVLELAEQHVQRLNAHLPPASAGVAWGLRNSARGLSFGNAWAAHATRSCAPLDKLADSSGLRCGAQTDAQPSACVLCTQSRSHSKHPSPPWCARAEPRFRCPSCPPCALIRSLPSSGIHCHQQLFTTLPVACLCTTNVFRRHTLQQSVPHDTRLTRRPHHAVIIHRVNEARSGPTHPGSTLVPARLLWLAELQAQLQGAPRSLTPATGWGCSSKPRALLFNR